MPASATASSASLSDEDVRAVLTGWKDLEPEHVELFVSSGVGRTLTLLERSGFQCLEGDLLLLLCPDPANYEASMAYMHGGNYALPAGTPGHVRWPGAGAPANGAPLAHLPPGVDAAPPFALGRFIAERFPAAVDKPNGTSMDVFYLPGTEVYSDVSLALVTSRQFLRIGPGVAPMLNANAQPSLVRAFVLDRINGCPRAQPHLTVA